jgi:hypothetical protein
MPPGNGSQGRCAMPKPSRRRVQRKYVTAFMPPPDAPTEQTRQVVPSEPTTAIVELQALPLTPFAFQTVVEAITAAGQVQRKRLNPKGGANLRYRIELASAFLADVLGSAYEAGIAIDGDPSNWSTCL